MLGRFSARLNTNAATEAPAPPPPAFLVPDSTEEAPPPPPPSEEDDGAAASTGEPGEAAEAVEPAEPATAQIEAPKPVPAAPMAFAESAAGAQLGKQKLLDAKV